MQAKKVGLKTTANKVQKSAKKCHKYANKITIILVKLQTGYSVNKQEVFNTKLSQNETKLSN